MIGFRCHSFRGPTGAKLLKAKFLDFKVFGNSESIIFVIVLILQLFFRTLEGAEFNLVFAQAA